MTNIDPQHYIDQAIKLENSKSIFEYLLLNFTSSRYEKIAEFYNKAGQIYKISNKEKAIMCFKKVLYYSNQLNDSYLFSDYNKKEIMLNLAELYSNIDYFKSIKYYEKIIDYYTEKGDIYNVVKYHEIIADIYQINNYFEESKQIYYKTLDLIHLNLSDRFYSAKKRICEKICEILLKSDNSVDILEAGKLYFDIANNNLNNKLSISILSAIKYILLGILANCAGDDIVNAKNNLEKYSNLHNMFLTSFEYEFIKNVIDAVESVDSETLSSLCSKFDKIKPLDNIYITLLSKIKKNININNYDDEIDNDKINDDINDNIDNVDFDNNSLDLS